MHSSGLDLISSICACDVLKTKNQLLGQLSHYKKSAPYYRSVIDIVKNTFDAVSSAKLTDINVSGLSVVCSYLSIPFAPILASEADFDIPPISHPGQWALEICTIVGAKTYLNTPGGKHLFKPEEFTDRGIALGFTGIPKFEYICPPYHYEPYLSILDVLMWNSPDEVRAQLGQTPVDFV